MIPIFAGKGSLGAFLPGHLKLLRRQFLAPFLVRFDNFFGHNVLDAHARQREARNRGRRGIDCAERKGKVRKSKHTLPGLLAVSAVAAFTLVLAVPCRAASCDDMVNLKLPNTVIKSAQQVAAGEFTVPGRGKVTDLPAFCRVVALVQPLADSDINVEIWLPNTAWKGAFHGNGNGGYGGSLAAGYAGMEAGLRRGYAAATTDMGTAPATGLNGDPLIGHPQKWKDWAMLSTHVMTVTGKAIAKAFYGEDAKHSYFSGCSTGGQGPHRCAILS
jgi:hypothetical protein